MELRGLAGLLTALLLGASAYGAACHRCARSRRWLAARKKTDDYPVVAIIAPSGDLDDPEPVSLSSCWATYDSGAALSGGLSQDEIR